MVIAAASMAADPDEGRTRGTHSLAGKSCAALELIGQAPRRSKPVVINACRHTAVELLIPLSWWWLDGPVRPYAGNANDSPRRSTAQAIRAFFAAMATTACQ